MEKIIDKLMDGYVLDLLKPKVNKFERAKTLKFLLEKKKLSIRQFSKEFNIPLGTLSGWLKWDKLGEKKYNKFKEKGFTESQITDIVKSSDMTPKIPVKEKELLLKVETLIMFMEGKRFNIKEKDIEPFRTLRNKLSDLIYKTGN